jgi:hypothetical protein
VASHLEFLDGAHAFGRIKNHDSDPACRSPRTSETLEGRLAGIARCGDEYDYLLVYAELLFCELHKRPHERQSQILEGERRSVIELEKSEASLESERRRARGGEALGLGGERGPQASFVEAWEEGFEDKVREFLVRKTAGPEDGGIESREGYGNI